MDDGRVDDDPDIAYQKKLIVEHNIWLNENSQLQKSQSIQEAGIIT